MTTWESTDNVEVMDDITITSDAAYERVTSDEHFEEEKNWWYLQQNTSWLVQEIPNIAFIDIADTMLESKKTLYDRENWILRVGKAGRSIEAQPQDTILLRLEWNQTYWPLIEARVPFDYDVSSSKHTTCEPDDTYQFNWYKVRILQTWYYTISYWWTIYPDAASDVIHIWAYSNAERIAYDYFRDSNPPQSMSWWKTIPNIKLNEWDWVWMKIYASNGCELQKNSYLSVQFQQYIL